MRLFLVRKKEFKFITYKPNKEIFSWSTKHSEDLTVKDPVILLSTPNNMIYKESESLIAAGLENSFIKLEQDAAERYLSKEYLAKFNLDDNEPDFVSVDQFIDGIQKTLWTTIQWFFGLLLGITSIVLVFLATILMVFQNSYRERISIRKFLGHSNFKIYRFPMLFVCLVIFIDMLSVMLFNSRIGIVYILLVSSLQLILFYKALINHQMNKIKTYLKS